MNLIFLSLKNLKIMDIIFCNLKRLKKTSISFFPAKKAQTRWIWIWFLFASFKELIKRNWFLQHKKLKKHMHKFNFCASYKNMTWIFCKLKKFKKSKKTNLIFASFEKLKKRWINFLQTSKNINYLHNTPKCHQP